MATKLSKSELMCALASANISIPTSASLSQLRSLYEQECILERDTDSNANLNANVMEPEEQNINLDETLLLLEKKRKVLQLQKELKELEFELTSGVQSLSINDIENMVPKFTGDNAYSIDKWIEDFENAIALTKCNSHFTYISARRLLSGTAAIFLRSSSAKTYDDLKKELLKQFKKNISVNDVYKELYARTRKPSENIIAYMLYMKEIAAQANLEDAEIISAIIEGLQDKSAHTSILYTAKNLEELQHLLLIYEKRRPKVAAVARKPAAEPRCFNCSKTGHWSTQCTQPKRITGSCFRCGATDHQIKSCPKKPIIANVEPTTTDDLDADHMPINFNQKVSVAFGSRSVNKIDFNEYFSLIDSGSPVSLICCRLLPFNISKDNQLTSSFCGLGGKPLTTFGQIKAEVSLNNIIREINFFIVDDNLIKYPLLLGRDFLFTFNIQLCMCKKAPLNEFNKVLSLIDKSCYALNSVHTPTEYYNNCVWKKENCSKNLVGCSLRITVSDFDCTYNEPSLAWDSSSVPHCNTIAPIDYCLEEKELEIGKFENIEFVDHVDNYRFIEEENSIFAIQIEEMNETLFDIDSSLSIDQHKSIASIIESCYVHQPAKYIDKPFEMTIKLTSDTPVFSPPRRLSVTDKENCQKIVDDLLARGIIRHSFSPYASPIVLVKKKNGETRMCVDFREINKLMVRDHYPLPLIEDCLEYLSGKTLFTLLDLKNGFHQVKMANDSVRYTSFVTPFGQFEYIMMPFGLTNAPSVFQRFINFILRDFIANSQIIVYMDDILIATENFEKHESILTNVLMKLSEYGLELKLPKCKFCYRCIEYLGYFVDSKGIRPNDEHKRNILEYPIPQSTKQLHSFIGLCAYFRKFIPQFSQLTKPLYDLLKKDVRFELSKECLNVINLLKQKLVECPVLAIYSPKRETELHCDASALGFGAVLLQKQEDSKFHPVFYFSKRTSPAERNYHSFELETLSIIYALRRFRVYLEGIPFKIITDCNSLIFTLSKKLLNARIARWALELQNYNYTIQHRSGVNMGHVDALSRKEVVSTIEESDLEFLLCATQNRDPEIVRIRSQLEKEQMEDFELQDGIVYKKDSQGKIYFYVPEEMESNVIRTIHEKIGHLGITKTYDHLKLLYWFPKMKAKIESFIKNCLKCIMYSAPARSNERNLHSIPKKSVPFDTIHIDHLGPLPAIKNKRRHILLVVDAFTKFAKLYPVISTSTKEVIESLKKYFCYYSRPCRIVSDRGTCFTSADFNEFLTKNNIEHVKVAVGSPQANGQAERVNRVITPILSKLSEPIQQSDWVSKLPDVEFAINNTIHCSTKKTPAELLFGVPQRGSVVDELSELLIERDLNIDRDFEKSREQAHAAILQSQLRNEENFRKNHKPAKIYKEGDYVVVKNVDTRSGINKKLIPKFKGPYRIDKELPNDRYIIKDLENCQITQIPYEGVIESRHLRLWCEPPKTKS